MDIVWLWTNSMYLFLKNLFLIKQTRCYGLILIGNTKSANGIWINKFSWRFIKSSLCQFYLHILKDVICMLLILWFYTYISSMFWSYYRNMHKLSFLDWCQHCLYVYLSLICCRNVTVSLSEIINKLQFDLLFLLRA